MTEQTFEAYLFNLRKVVSQLSLQAQSAQSMHDYLQATLSTLTHELPFFSRYQLIESTQHTGRSSELWTVPIQDSAAKTLATIEFQIPSDDDAAWEVIQLWADSVGQTWSYHQLKSSAVTHNVSERLQLFEKLSYVVQQTWADPTDIKGLIMACEDIVNVLTNIDQVGIVMNDHEPEYGTVVAAYPRDGIGQKIQLQDNWVYEHFQTKGTPIVINDIHQDTHILGENLKLLASFGIKSTMLLPLQVQDIHVGSIGFDALNQKHTFSDSEVEVCSAVAAQIAVSLQNAHLFRTLQETADSQQLVNTILGQLPLRSDLENLMYTTGNLLGSILGADKFSIHLNSPELKTTNMNHDTD